MDSVSQAALGAAVGEAVLGNRVGRKAALWGAALGTLPDLDVLAHPFMDEVAQLSWHRGYSHSLLAVVVLSPIVGWGLARLHKGQASSRAWAWLAALVLSTHILLDCFTVYGTQVFKPFSNYQVGFNSISIIDPLYTLPLLLGLIVAMFFRKGAQTRRTANTLGLALSTTYIVITIAVKGHIGNVIDHSLHAQQLQHSRYMSAPTLFNSVLWRATVETDGGFYVGYHSLLDDDALIDFKFVPRQDSALEPYAPSKAVKRLTWFSNGYYALSQTAGTTYFHDLRFGEIETGGDDGGRYVFTWQLNRAESGEVELVRQEPSIKNPSRAINWLYQRMLGVEGP